MVKDDEVMDVLKRYPDFEYVQMNDDSILSVPGLEIYPNSRKIYRGRKEISLTAKEYDLFYLLVVNRGRYMGITGTACGSFPLAFPGLLQYFAKTLTGDSLYSPEDLTQVLQTVKKEIEESEINNIPAARAC